MYTAPRGSKLGNPWLIISGTAGTQIHTRVNNSSVRRFHPPSIRRGKTTPQPQHMQPVCQKSQQSHFWSQLEWWLGAECRVYPIISYGFFLDGVSSEETGSYAQFGTIYMFIFVTRDSGGRSLADVNSVLSYTNTYMYINLGCFLNGLL